MPKRTIPGAGKKVPLNMRTTAALRKKIEKAAGKSGRSLVQEVEHRVERSFMRDEANGEIERIRGHVLGMLNVTDGKVEKLRRDVVEMLHGLAGKVVTFDGLVRDDAQMKRLIEVLLDGPMHMTVEQRAALRDMLQAEVRHG